MNIKLNDFVKKMKFGYYTVYMKGDIQMFVHVTEGRKISANPLGNHQVYMSSTEFQEKHGDDIVHIENGVNTPAGHDVNQVITDRLQVGSTGKIVEYGYDDVYDFFVSEMCIQGEDVLVMTYYTSKDNIKSCSIATVNDIILSYSEVQL
ncbi:hypothetical protein [Aeromonas phage AS-sw]|uniref:Uncharacterized protein n=1 Tax=Aeromonas phage AS-sw TaxID=2026113 RepID=A0A291LFH6_9CAUD|nr:hypothetical protein HWB29_gp106 [Aeromonas phage AS-sw]ATI18156.1 hypothetical protein [Aeromonas phage AS-sw]